MVKVLQYNCQSLKTNKSYIDSFIIQNQIDIVALQEIYSHDDSIEDHKLLNFKLLKKTRPAGYGGVAIGFKNNIKFRKVKYPTQYDLIIAKTLNLTLNLTVCCLYLPPNVTAAVFESEMSRLIVFLNTQENVLLLGDFNARMVRWGDTVDSLKGRVLGDLLMCSQLRCLNDGSKTYFVHSVLTG